jgi:sterol desaturase/sphingolipid hydroxylase (fatty acid hydroxylase superfamily)
LTGFAAAPLLPSIARQLAKLLLQLCKGQKEAILKKPRLCGAFFYIFSPPLNICRAVEMLESYNYMSWLNISLENMSLRGSSLSIEIAVFLLLSVLINRKQLLKVMQKAFPSGIKVNSLSFLFDAMVVGPLLAAMVVLITEHISKSSMKVWSTSSFDSIPILVTALLVVFMGDLIGYFRHRLEHTAWLWPVHSMHHSDRDMTWLSLYRIHPLNRFTTSVIDTTPLLLIGFPLWAIILNSLFRHWYGLLIHANLPWTYGVLGKIFVSPAMHRWHHVRQGEGVGSNFANVFSIFDRMFKTYYVPGPCLEPLGTDRSDYRSFSKQIFNPLSQWSALLSHRKAAIQLSSTNEFKGRVSGE